MPLAPRFRWTVVLPLTALLLGIGCTDQTAPRADIEGPLISIQSPDLGPAILVQERHTPALMRREGVVGTGVGFDDGGRPAVMILAEHELRDVPSELDGIPVEVLVTGRFYALQDLEAQGKPTCGKKNLPPCPEEPPSLPPTARFPRPVPIGVSTGHPNVTAGTIGARVRAGNNVFALSNNHVYADENRAPNGDPVIQPGRFDGGRSPADNIGTLFDYEPIVFGGACVNTIDAAIASTTTELLGTSTPGQGYGTPKTQTIAPALNMKVKKFGRTTGQTTGTIQALNATVNVGYDTGFACFTGQIVITPGSFSSGGDSGSLIVVNGKGKTRADDRRPLGLLFAGSPFQTIANPIDPVLERFGVTIDGEQ